MFSGRDLEDLPWAKSFIFILAMAAIGLLAVLGGGVWLIAWLIQHAEPTGHTGTKVTLRNHGTYQGMWAEDARCVMAVVTRSPAIAKGYQEVLPFVVAYVKTPDGTLPEFPFGMNFQNGELNLQIPRDVDRDSRVIPMSKIIELLKIEDESRKERQRWRIPRAMPGDPQACIGEINPLEMILSMADLTFEQIVSEDPEIVGILAEAGVTHEAYTVIYNRKRKRIEEIDNAIGGGTPDVACQHDGGVFVAENSLGKFCTICGKRLSD